MTKHEREMMQRIYFHLKIMMDIHALVGVEDSNNIIDLMQHHIAQIQAEIDVFEADELDTAEVA